MGFKKKSKYMSFADLEMIDSDSRNKSLSMLRELNQSVNWGRIEELLLEEYSVGASSAGNSAYSPLLLFKCLLLQKWFRIKSDPELESQINDRVSFKDFLGIPLGDPSPDHSTFSRYRGRISKQVFDRVIGEILRQFSVLGLSINEGVAIDARLVKSASHPISKSKLDKLKTERLDPQSELDRNGNPKKFTRDMESDWTVKNDTPHFGLKEHTSVDVNYGFVLSTSMTPASVHDTRMFQYCTLYSRHTDADLKEVYADKGYHSELNRSFLLLNGFADRIMRKNTTRARLTPYEKLRNKGISKIRYIVEQYFGLSHLHDGAARARFTTIAKNNVDLWYRQVAFNIRRGLKIMKVLDAC